MTILIIFLLIFATILTFGIGSLTCFYRRILNAKVNLNTFTDKENKDLKIAQIFSIICIWIGIFIQIGLLILFINRVFM